MGYVVSYDDEFGAPHSEIALASGEHIFVTLDQNGIVVKALARPGSTQRVLFEGNPTTVAKICAGLFDDTGGPKTSPLHMLVAAMTQMPNSAAVEGAFKTAAAV
jgi:hypothetical protein